LSLKILNVSGVSTAPAESVETVIDAEARDVNESDDMVVPGEISAESTDTSIVNPSAISD
jgi:hypothetical protein